jgi:hypothetical protein
MCIWSTSRHVAKKPHVQEFSKNDINYPAACATHNTTKYERRDPCLRHAYPASTSTHPKAPTSSRLDAPNDRIRGIAREHLGVVQHVEFLRRVTAGVEKDFLIWMVNQRTPPLGRKFCMRLLAELVDLRVGQRCSCRMSSSKGSPSCLSNRRRSY